MKSQPSSEELVASLEGELQRAGFTPERLCISWTGTRYWSLRVEVGGRPFSAGVDHRGLYCWDISERNEKNLIPPAVGPIFGDPIGLSRDVARLMIHALHDLEFAFGEPQIL